MKKSITFFVLFALIFIVGCTPGEQVSGSPAPQYRISEEIVVYSDAKWTRLGNHELVEQYSEEKHYMETDAPKKRTFTVNGKEYEGEYKGSYYKGDPVVYDIYVLRNDPSAAMAEVVHETGKLCSVAMADLTDGGEEEKTPEELERLARDFLSAYTDMTRYENAEKNLSQEPASNGSYFMKFTVSPSKYGGRDEQCSVFIDRYGKISSFQCAGYNTDWMLDERIVIDTAACRKAAEEKLAQVYKGTECKIEWFGELENSLRVDENGELGIAYGASVSCGKLGGSSVYTVWLGIKKEAIIK